MGHDGAPVGVPRHVHVRRADIREIDADTDRIALLLNRARGFQQTLANTHHSPVRRHEMLLATIEYRSHRHRDDGILLLDAAQTAPVLLHALAVLAEAVSPGRLEIAVLFGPIARVVDPK